MVLLYFKSPASAMNREKLRAKIKENYCNFTDLSRELGKDKDYISSVLRGKQGVPMPIFFVLADKLGVSPIELKEMIE